jgi:hypothetical protein
MRTLLTLVAVAALAVPAPALAEPPPQSGAVVRRAELGGKNEISTQIGAQGALGGTTPGGLKLLFDYSRQMTNYVWLNFKVNPTFGAGSARAVCYDRFGNPYDCGSSGVDADGHAIDLLAGIKLKFPTKYSLVPYAQADVGVVPIFSRPRNDDGAALVFRTGGGLRWFVTPHVGIGGELNVTLGGGFYSASCDGCNNGHNEFYRAIDFGIGAEFLL